MSVFLDTSVTVRYLVADPPDMAARAAQIIDGEPELQITDVVLAETAYVLTSVYRIARARVIDQLMELVSKDNIRPFGLDKSVVLQALLLCQPSARVSVADALTWAAARCAGNATVFTFDRRFPSDGIGVSG